MEKKICDCCLATIELVEVSAGQVENVKLQDTTVPEVQVVTASPNNEATLHADDVKFDEENSACRTTVAEQLALIFEYPFVIREEKTVFRTSGEHGEFLFCEKCEKALCQLHSIYEQFTKLLHNESRVLATIQKIGDQLVNYKNSDAKCQGKNLTRVQTTRKQAVTNTSRLRTRRKKNLLKKIETEKRLEFVEDSDSQSKLECLDDDPHDPTFSPKKKKFSMTIESKSERKRSERQSRQEKRIPSSDVNSNTESSTGDVEPKNAQSNKRKRCLKKEYWIEKAKSDPSKTCNICGKVFLYPRMMLHHKSTVHEGKKPYECQNCGRCFTQNFILKKHTCDYSLAGGDREYLKIAREQELFKWSCEICSKRFKVRSSLTVHQMNHAGETFKCEKCEKSFRRPDHLKTHVKIVHSEEKKYICSKCGQKFKTSSNLRAHERIHVNSSDQQHLCNICGKSIRTLSQMGRHQKTHEDVLPYECQICGKKFKMKDYLGQHLRKGKLCSGRLNKMKTSDNNDPLVGRLNDNQDFQPIQFPSGEPGVLSPTMEFPTYSIPVVDNGNITHL